MTMRDRKMTVAYLWAAADEPSDLRIVFGRRCAGKILKCDITDFQSGLSITG